jgi:hypothetical protein
MNTSGVTETTVGRKPKLLDQIREALRLKHYNVRTEEIFVHWIRRFILYHGQRHPQEMAEPEATQFLTHLAVQEHVSPSLQMQARAALVFLYRHVLQRPLGPLQDVVRASRAVRAGRGPRRPQGVSKFPEETK